VTEPHSGLAYKPVSFGLSMRHSGLAYKFHCFWLEYAAAVCATAMWTNSDSHSQAAGVP